MDISRFLEDFMRELASVKTEKNLRRIRRAAGYSQSELSRLSGVNIRNIQLYEQGVQDINRASAATLAALARPLACSIENLME
jgi:transcriptional regulator with XRE-family HTH domain